MTKSRAILIPAPKWRPRPSSRWAIGEPFVVEMLDIERCDFTLTPAGMTSPGAIVRVCDTAILVASGAPPEYLTVNPVAQSFYCRLVEPERRQAIVDLAEIIAGPVLVFGAAYAAPSSSLVELVAECWRMTIERHRRDLRVVR